MIEAINHRQLNKKGKLFDKNLIKIFEDPHLEAVWSRMGRNVFQVFFKEYAAGITLIPENIAGNVYEIGD